MFEEKMKTLILEGAVAHALGPGRRNAARTARNLGEMAAHLWNRPAPPPDDPLFTRLLEALEARDREGLLALLMGR